MWSSGSAVVVSKQIGLNRAEAVEEWRREEGRVSALGHVMTADYLGASDRL